MKQQVVRFSPHQNGKVFAILMAISSLVFFVPFALIGILAMPKGAGPSLIMMIFLPLGYLIFGYLSIAVGCWFYNLMFKYIGGIEYESASESALDERRSLEERHLA